MRTFWVESPLIDRIKRILHDEINQNKVKVELDSDTEECFVTVYDNSIVDSVKQKLINQNYKLFD